MQMNLRSYTWTFAAILLLSGNMDIRAQEAVAHKTSFPMLVSDNQMPQSIALLLNALGTIKHPDVQIDNATKENIIGFVEEVLKGSHIKDLRVDKPLLLSNPTKTSYQSHNDSSLKLICAILERAKLQFAIRENYTFVFEPTHDDCVEYRVEFAGYTGGRETFKITERR